MGCPDSCVVLSRLMGIMTLSVYIVTRAEMEEQVEKVVEQEKKEKMLRCKSELRFYFTF